MPHFFNPRQNRLEQKQPEFLNIKKSGINVDKLTNIYKSSQYSNVNISYRDIEEEPKDLYGGNEPSLDDRRHQTSQNFRRKKFS